MFPSSPLPLGRWVRSLTALGALNGFLAVALGAAGTHAFSSHFVARGAEWYALAGQYQVIHAFALFVAAWMSERVARPGLARFAGVCFAVGIVLFSGALYFRALGGEGWFAHTVPIGGSVWLIGWLVLLVAALR